MKAIVNITLFTTLALFLVSCSDSTEAEAKKKGVEIWFSELVHDYGEIPVGSDGNYSFAFKNLSDSAIIVNRVRSTCGCTIPSWPKVPVESGDSARIIVSYNTAQAGAFSKSVYVYSSAANSPVKLQIKGRVVPSEEKTK